MCDVYRYEQMSVFAVVIPPLDYLRDTLSGQGVEVSSLDSAGLCALKEAINLVSVKFYISNSTDPPKTTRAPKIATQKKQPISILRDDLHCIA